MASVSALTVLPSNMRTTQGFHQYQHQRPRSSVTVIRDMPRKKQSLVPVMRLFGPAIFEASKLKVLFVGADGQQHPWKLPRTYTLTHSDVTSMLTLAISETINNSQLQGWYNKLQRDEVVAEWKKVKGKMSLHVHCHVSGGHFLLDLIAKFRHYIFRKELPVVLKAFVHGDYYLFNNYPELQDAMVWVYFHSNIEEYNKVECWGALRDAPGPAHRAINEPRPQEDQENIFKTHNINMPEQCKQVCTCCFPSMSSIPWSQDHVKEVDPGIRHGLQLQS
ncbi:hypothetical protein Droror1_Dr00010456 [Drosera rotundifolia]